MSTKKKGHTPGRLGGGLAYQAQRSGRASILVSGRLDRGGVEAIPTALALPAELRTRIELLQLGGGIHGAIVGLLHFALDQIEEHKIELRIDLGG